MKKRQHQLTIVAQMPPPARRLQNVVQQMLRLGPQQAKRTVQSGQVFVNERPKVSPDLVLEVGDEVEIVRPEELGVSVPRVTRVEKVRVLFQDEHLVVVEKPAGILTVPTPYRENITLISELRKLLLRDHPGKGKSRGARRSSDEFPDDVFCVHRLDRDVSGVLVFGKTLEIAEALRSQFSARKPLRSYEAIVTGYVREASGTFQNFLATDKHLNRYSVDSEEEGELAITHFEVTRRLGDATLVTVRLETGRRNQIRVQFADAGHPILGDTRYRRRMAQHPDWPHRRLALHAQVLGFAHPITGESLEFRSSLPESMQLFLERPEAGTA